MSFTPQSERHWPESVKWKRKWTLCGCLLRNTLSFLWCGQRKPILKSLLRPKSATGRRIEHLFIFRNKWGCSNSLLRSSRPLKGFHWSGTVLKFKYLLHISCVNLLHPPTCVLFGLTFVKILISLLNTMDVLRACFPNQKLSIYLRITFISSSANQDLILPWKCPNVWVILFKALCPPCERLEGSLSLRNNLESMELTLTETDFTLVWVVNLFTLD